MRTSGKPNVAVVDAPDDVPADGLVATGRALQRTQTQFATAIAVQKPRKVEMVQAAVLKEAAMAGEAFFYSWTTKNKDGSTGLIEGVSIDGALILVRNWGNCATVVELHEDAPMHWVLSASFIDHETGYTGNRLFRQRKGQSPLNRHDKDRGADIDFQIGQSKAIRNVVLNCMPPYMVDKAMGAAKTAAEAAIGDLPAAITNVVAAFSKIKVTEPMLVWKVGVEKAKWQKRDVVMLRSIGNAIKLKQTTAENEFGEYEDPNAPKPSPEDKSTPEATAGGAGSEKEVVEGNGEEVRQGFE